MRLALDEAAKAQTHDDVPIGAIVVRDEEVIAAADEAGLAMIFTGMRHFRH